MDDSGGPPEEIFGKVEFLKPWEVMPHGTKPVNFWVDNGGGDVIRGLYPGNLWKNMDEKSNFRRIGWSDHMVQRY